MGSNDFEGITMSSTRRNVQHRDQTACCLVTRRIPAIAPQLEEVTLTFAEISMSPVKPFDMSTSPTTQ